MTQRPAKMGTAADRIANAAVVAGAALYVSLLAFAFMSTAGDAFLRGFMVDQTPANFVFVALTQVVGCAWLLAGTLRVFELSRGRVMARALLGHASWERPPVTARDVAVLASIGTKTVVGFIGLYSGLCWDESRDGAGSEKTCVGAVGSLFDGSPVVIEFFACVAVASLLVLPWPLPAHRARRAFLRVLWECLGYAFCFPAFGPFASKTTTDGDARDAAAMRRQNSVRERLLAAGGGGEGEVDETSSAMDVHENRNVLGHRNGNGNDPDRDDVASVADSVMTQSSPWWSERSPVDLAHVLVADALTSAGLMLWQGEFTACLFVTSSWSASRTPGVGVGKQGEQCAGFGNANSLLAKPIAIALPFWIRLWQCVAQARHAAKTKARPSGHVSSSARDSSTLHLLNAVKYASCLAVIGCSVCIQMAELDGIRRGVGAWHGTFWNVSEDAWWKTWICLLCLKTAFTFAWDVVVDWGLARVGCDGRAARVGCLCPCCDDGLDSDMDTDGGGGDSDDERDSGDVDAAGDSPAPAPGAPNRRPRRYPPFLRKELLFVKPARYYAAVAFNLVGRTTWGLAISPHVCEGACVLSLGIVELVRRAAWTTLRVENEVIRTHAERRRRRRLGIRNAERYARAFRNSPLNRSRRVSSVTSLGNEIETPEPPASPASFVGTPASP